MVAPHSLSPSPDTRSRGHALSCRQALTPADLELHHRIRHTVFVTEQAVFTDDRDEADGHPEVQHVVGLVDGIIAGCVRLYPVDSPAGSQERLWKGDRLAVLPDHRFTGIAGDLVRHAVTSAGELGGDRMIAWIQLSNVGLFRKLGWAIVGEPQTYVGQPHQQMTIALR